MALRGIGSPSWILAGLAIHLWAVVGPPVHLLWEPHEACLEHGELIHRHEPSGDTTPLGSSTEIPSLGTGRADPGTRHSHVHCLLAQDRSRDTMTTGVRTHAYRDVSCIVSAFPTRESPGPRPVLTVAPKQSPPVG